MFPECPDPRNPLTDAPFYRHPVIPFIPSQPPPPSDARLLFERWITGQARIIPRWTAPEGFGLDRERWDPERYRNIGVDAAWMGFQAALALTGADVAALTPPPS